jgi:uncharacterized protein
MRFTLDRHPTANLVTSVAAGEIRVGDVVITRSVILSAGEIIYDWPVTATSGVDLESLQPALALSPEVILLGTGARIEFPDAGLIAELATRGIGLEVMDTPAACRTFNVLVNEDRPVAAALILP